jgi:hypothetical protein
LARVREEDYIVHREYHPNKENMVKALQIFLFSGSGKKDEPQEEPREEPESNQEKKVGWNELTEGEVRYLYLIGDALGQLRQIAMTEKDPDVKGRITTLVAHVESKLFPVPEDGQEGYPGGGLEAGKVRVKCNFEL